MFIQLVMMQLRNFVSIAGAALSLAASAFAGTSVKASSSASVLVATEACFSGNVYAGYASNYICRGIVASHSLAEGDGAIPAGVNLNCKLNDCNSIAGSASYTSLISGHHMAGERDFSFHNETHFNFGWKNRNGLLNNLSTTLGWNLIHGGLLGNLVRYDYNSTWISDEDVYRRNAHSVVQEFYLTLDYDLTKNWFAGVTASYAFQGVTGWWFQPYLSYQTSICSSADFVLSAGVSATSSYFDNKSLFMSNGSQAWWVKAELPVRLGMKNLSFVPFVSFNWAGEGALKANRATDRGDKPYKNFGVVAGASFVYSF